MGLSVKSLGQTVGPTTLGPWRLLISMQRSISMPIFIKIARGQFTHTPIIGLSVTSVGQGVGPTTLGPWRLLISMQRSISMPIFIKIAQAVACRGEGGRGWTAP